MTTREYVTRRLAAGAKQKEVAAELGVSRQRVHQIASDLPLLCRCGCGGLIPATQPGFRVYLPGHGHPGSRCPTCGAVKSPTGEQCFKCRWAAVPVDDLTDQPFGSWVVLGVVTPDCGVAQRRRWWCQCGCGVVRPVWERNLAGGLSEGCSRCGYERRKQRRVSGLLAQEAK